jgi:exodeoxyribonuclease-3
MKVASFNVNSIRARLDIVVEWINKESPDVLCLQETKVEDSEFPGSAFEDINYYCVYHGEKSYNGVAIVSKSPPEDVRVGFDEDGGEGTRIISVRIDKIPVVNTYVPQGFHPLSEKFRYKLGWLERLREYFDKNYRPDRPLLWLGDFNVAPKPIDVYDPEHLLGQVAFHPDEHAALERITQWGLVDVFRIHECSGGQYTFWDYRIKNAVKRKIGWRVDHIWATRPLAKRSVKAWIDMEPRLKERPSDHTFIVAEFDLKKR